MARPEVPLRLDSGGGQRNLDAAPCCLISGRDREVLIRRPIPGCDELEPKVRKMFEGGGVEAYSRHSGGDCIVNSGKC